MSEFPAWGPDKGTGNPEGIWPWGPDHRPSTGLGEAETPVLEGTHTILHAPRLRGEEQGPTGDWSKPTCWCWRASLGGVGWQGRPQRAGALEGLPWHKPSWRLPLTRPRSCRPEGWVTSDQTTTREGVLPRPSANNWMKALLSRCCPQSKTQFFPPPIPPLRSLPKPLSLLHQRADRGSKKHSSKQLKPKPHYRSYSQWKKQEVMSQMKRQSKAPENS